MLQLQLVYSNLTSINFYKERKYKNILGNILSTCGVEVFFQCKIINVATLNLFLPRTIDKKDMVGISCK